MVKKYPTNFILILVLLLVLIVPTLWIILTQPIDKDSFLVAMVVSGICLFLLLGLGVGTYGALDGKKIKKYGYFFRVEIEVDTINKMFVGFNGKGGNTSLYIVGSDKHGELRLEFENGLYAGGVLKEIVNDVLRIKPDIKMDIYTQKIAQTGNWRSK